MRSPIQTHKKIHPVYLDMDEMVANGINVSGRRSTPSSRGSSPSKDSTKTLSPPRTPSGLHHSQRTNSWFTFTHQTQPSKGSSSPSLQLKGQPFGQNSQGQRRSCPSPLGSPLVPKDFNFDQLSPGHFESPGLPRRPSMEPSKLATQNLDLQEVVANPVTSTIVRNIEDKSDTAVTDGLPSKVTSHRDSGTSLSSLTITDLDDLSPSATEDKSTKSNPDTMVLAKVIPNQGRPKSENGRCKPTPLVIQSPITASGTNLASCGQDGPMTISPYDSKFPYLLNLPPISILDDRDHPPKLMKEPRGLYGSQKDLNPNQCAPRWPYECQVLPNKVRHIRSVPSVPELFYEPTGKEPMPRPLGEEHGVVVYEYYPTSSVNYFSRSVSGPSANGQVDPAATPCDLRTDHLSIQADSLKFESRFESGNLAKVIRITETYYELHLRPDLYTGKHCQWFYFQVENMRSDLNYRFSIVNFSKPDSLYNYGMKPVLYSTVEAERHYVGWSRVGHNIRYYRNEAVFDEEDGYSYTLSFNLTFPHDEDKVYLAHCYPYTYSDMQDDLNAIQNNEARAKYCSQRLLCRTLAGNNVYILTITSPASQEDLKRKSVIVLSARVHPGETPSSWIMRGILHFLTGESEVAAELRDRFIFKIVPMLNPDGVIVGNTRCSLAARDLNRQYKSVIKEAFPPVFHIKTLVRRLMEESGVVFYCDLHAHSRKFNVFIYGCENRRHSEKFLKEQVFPLMLHKNTAEKFSFEDCRFHIQRQKETTGRVVFWNMGITCSYTLEASYGGTNLGSRAFTHFNTDDYEGIGRYFCETLQDFQDPCPVNEQLRAKIVTRLLKEGSSANDPANIALSDYSSLSSGADDNDDDLDDFDDQEDAGFSELNNTIDGQVYHNHRRGEARRKSRRIRSRRQRLRNVGGGLGGAQFNSQQSINFFSDYKQVEKYVQFGNNMLRRSDSDKVLVNKDSNSPSNSTKKTKKNKRKNFKRSLTMTSLPIQLFKDCGSKDEAAKNWEKAKTHEGNQVENNNTVSNATKFTIGTSDESDEDDNAENCRDLERLFCPLTDTNGSPLYEPQDDQSEQSGIPEIPPLQFAGEQLSAVSCRRVHSEILASVSKIRCSLLGRKGGLLHSYGHYGSEVHLNEYSGGAGEKASHQSPNSADVSRAESPVKSISTPNKSGGKKAKNQNAITVQLPSPAGSRKVKSRKTNSSKNWEKGFKVSKAVKVTESNQPVLKQSMSTRQLNNSNGGLSPSQSIKRKKKKKKPQPMTATVALANTIKYTTSSPNLTKRTSK